jgi:hypothetical protein
MVAIKEVMAAIDEGDNYKAQCRVLRGIPRSTPLYLMGRFSFLHRRELTLHLPLLSVC